MRKIFLCLGFAILFTACNGTKNNVVENPPNMRPTEATTDIEVSTNKEIDEKQETTDRKQEVPDKKQEVTDKKQEVTDYSFFGNYQMVDDFANDIEQNPIDADYEKEFSKLSNSSNFNTQAWVELEDKYTKIWDKELNYVYKKLLSKLSQKEQSLLIESQKGWLQMHIHESQFVGEVFYNRDSGPILGSQGRVQMIMAAKNRIRQRTLELMEYYYLLENVVEFQYKSNLE